MKNFWVIFDENGARIVKTVQAPASNVLENPEMPRGVPPHLWRLVDGKIAVVGAAVPVPAEAVVPVVGKDLSLIVALVISACVATVILLLN